MDNILLKMNNIIQQTFDDTIWYFKEISKHYRNSTECNKCWVWLLKEIKKLKLKPTTDNFSETSKLAKEKYGNIMFDIPENDNTLDPIILQGHYDMVVVSDDLEETRENGIQIQQERTKDGVIFHSKKYKTSLGADDGIGVALCLALAKNRQSFKHGNIRIILTADEEIACGGSESKEIKKWLIYDKLINLDDNELTNVKVGCFGACQTNFVKKVNIELFNHTKNLYEISISNLLGGHSAGVNNLQGNAIKILFDFISKIPDVQLIEYDNLNNIKTNAIPNAGKMIIATRFNKSEIKDLYLKQKLKTIYKLDKHLIFKVKSIRTFEPKCVSEKDTKEIINFIKCLHFGVIKEDKNKFPKLTANVSPLECFKANKNDNIIRLTTFNRADDIKLINNVNSEIRKNCKKLEWKIDGQFIDPAWKAKKKSKMQAIFKQAAGMTENPIKFEITPAWVEPADLKSAKPEMDIISIGPRSDDCHTIRETLYVDTVSVIIEELLYTLELLKKEV